MRPASLRRTLPYLGATLVVCCALLLRLPLWPILGTSLPYITLFPAVLVAAYFGGLGPGLFATALGALGASYFVIEPRWSLALTTPGDVAGSILFLGGATAITWLCESLRRSERRQAEATRQARESEERFAGFMQHLAGLAWIKDADGRYVFANDAAVQTFGAPREQLYGRTDAEVFPPETAGQFRENDQKALASGSGVQVIETLRHPDGTVHHSLVSKFPIPAPDGSPPLVGGMAIDVTELRRAEEGRQFLAEAGEVLASSLDHEVTLAAVARLVVPRLADWCSVYLTDAGGLRRLTIAHADPMKMAWAQQIANRYPPDPDDQPGVGRVLRTGEPHLVPEVTNQMLVAGVNDTGYREMLLSLGIRSAMIVPLVARGRTLGAITFVAAESGRRYGPVELTLARDLARRAALAVDNARLFRDSEEALRLLSLLVEASARLTGSLELPAVGEAILVLSHRLVAADAYAIWRRDPTGDDWVVANSAGLSDDYLRAATRVPARGSAMPERPIVVEDVRNSEPLANRREAYRAEGIESLLVVPLRVHGQVAGTIVFYYRTRQRFDEVTVRVATALADLAGAALGTAELYQRQADLRRRAEEADKRKDEFLATLGHELRNPLAVIVTGLHALRELGEVALDRVPAMDRQAAVLHRLVDDVLDMARANQGRIELRREPVRLAEVIARAIETARPVTEAQRHVLEVDLPSDEVWLDADPVRLTQCVSNLLHNAVKYTQPGGHIVVSAERGTRKAEWQDEDAAREPSSRSEFRAPRSEFVEIRVRDTGMGIPPTELERIFELFAQVRDARSRSQGGLGIGLSLVRRLVGMMGGTVTAHSDGPGLGSEFVIRLPAAAPPPTPVVPAASFPAVTPPPTRPLRVVVADDNADAAETLSVLVELWGYSVRVANDGPGAVAAAREFRPDVCLFDIGMPGFDGYEAARRVRAEPGLGGVVLVAMTGFGQDGERSAAAGFDHFMVKPVAPTAVEQLLRELSLATNGA